MAKSNKSIGQIQKEKLKFLLLRESQKESTQSCLLFVLHVGAIVEPHLPSHLRPGIPFHLVYKSPAFNGLCQNTKNENEPQTETERLRR